MLVTIIVTGLVKYNKLNEEYNNIRKSNEALQTKIQEMKILHEDEVSELKEKHFKELSKYDYKRDYNAISRDSGIINRDAEGTYLGWFSSTGYCTEDWRGTGKHHPCNSGDPTIGAMGEKVIPYQTIAVDPNAIPLGSQLKIVDEYGNTYYVKANDTGGAIKGNKIDMVCDSHTSALSWGRRKVQIWLLN